LFNHPYIWRVARFGAPNLQGTLFCLAAGIAFSFSPVLIQVAYAHGAAVSGVLAWRYLVAALMLALLAGRRLQAVPARAALAAFALGACVYALDSALFFGALERTSAPLASLVHYAHLALVVGLAAIAGRERLTRRRLVALATILGGVALVGGAATSPDGIGIAMALGSAAAYAAYILASDRLLRDADPLALAAFLTAGAATSFLVAGSALGSLGTVGGPAGIACLVGAAGIGSVFAVTAFLRGVRLVGPSTASLLVTVEVPVTIALAAFVLKQHLTPPQLIGATLVVTAIVVLQLRRPAARRPALRLASRPPAAAPVLGPAERLAA
jgi:drug/metabolite transporter (DMT)-like permease